jgi:hypothetical protein
MKLLDLCKKDHTIKTQKIQCSTFIALIRKKDRLVSFDDFRPIALCNCLYKIITKFIAARLKPILASSITAKQFGFLKGHPIHEAIGSAQEGIHTIKTQKRQCLVVKIELVKSL